MCSYHDGDHYASVRMLSDMCLGPAEPVTIGGLAAAGAAPAVRRMQDDQPQSKEEKMIVATTGCRNLDIVREVCMASELRRCTILSDRGSSCSVLADLNQ